MGNCKSNLGTCTRRFPLKTGTRHRKTLPVAHFGRYQMEGHVLLGKLNPAMSRHPALVSPEEQSRQIFSLLARTWAPQHWWPAQSRFEVIVGAFLTQNTNWANVERAIRQLRAARALTVS